MPSLMRKRTGPYQGPACPDCRRVLVTSRVITGSQSCPYCQIAFQGTAFQPPERLVKVLQTAEAGPGGAVSCAKHERNAAVTTCGRCGLFICALCRINADNQVLCPPCFERLSAEGTLASTRTSFRDYSGSARNACVVGILFWPVAVILGGVCVFYSLKGLAQKRTFKESDGVTGLYVTLVLGILEIIGALLIWVAVFGGFK